MVTLKTHENRLQKNLENGDHLDLDSLSKLTWIQVGWQTLRKPELANFPKIDPENGQNLTKHSENSFIFLKNPENRQNLAKQYLNFEKKLPTAPVLVYQTVTTNRLQKISPAAGHN